MLTAYPIRLFLFVSSAPGSARNLHVRYVRSGFSALSMSRLSATITPTGIGFKSGEYATHFSTIIAPTAGGWQGCHVWHCWVACRITISQPLIRQQKKKFRFINWLTIFLLNVATSGRCKVNQPKPIRLYWLRAMDCADRLMPAQSRQQARQYDDGSWQNTFKQGILLADAKITPYERRQLVARIEALSTEIPGTGSPTVSTLARRSGAATATGGRAPTLQ
ncbi:putative lipoprotein [Escherichia coli]|uniref:Putative lipoprotein n=1 Tax=Escherichia coli TaxID=562 RepID=A0A376NT02_ECOLX|nr:putative lipoprotein [Escherichia coli]